MIQHLIMAHKRKLNKRQPMLYNLAIYKPRDRSFVKLKDSLPEYLNNIYNAIKSPEHVTGLSTGIMYFDQNIRFS